MSQPVTVPPVPALQPFITGYAHIHIPLPEGHTFQTRVMPLGCPAILLLTEGQIRITDGNAADQVAPPISFVGQLTRSGGNEYSGVISGFLIQFTPAGAFDLLGCEVSQYQNLTLPLAAVLGESAAHALAADLHAAPSFEARCEVANAFLLDILTARKATTGLGSKAAELLTGSNGLMEIEDVASRLQVSVRTLLRRFTREVGMSPKTFARLMRFRMAHAFLQDSQARWADAVLRFGYTDQSHLIRDYRDFAGETPKQFRTEARVIDRIFGELTPEPTPNADQS